MEFLKEEKLIKNSLADQDNCDEDALSEAAFEGDMETVQRLTPTSPQSAKDLALISATQKGHVEVMKYLIRMGADMNARYFEDYPAPLFQTIMQDQIEAFCFLINQPNIDLSFTTPEGENYYAFAKRMKRSAFLFYVDSWKKEEKSALPESNSTYLDILRKIAGESKNPEMIGILHSYQKAQGNLLNPILPSYAEGLSQPDIPLLSEQGGQKNVGDFRSPAAEAPPPFSEEDELLPEESNPEKNSFGSF